MLARLHRAGELTYVFVPRVDDEAMRDLTLAREDAKKAQRVAQQQLNGMLLRLGFRYCGKNWSLQHLRWLADQKMPTPVQQVVFQEYINAINETTARLDRLARQIETLVPALASGSGCNGTASATGRFPYRCGYHDSGAG